MPAFINQAGGPGESETYSLCAGCCTAIFQVIMGLMVIIMQSIIHGRYTGEYESLKEITQPFPGFIFGALFLITGGVGMVSASKNKAAILLYLVLSVLSILAGIAGVAYFGYVTSLTDRTVSVLEAQYGCSVECDASLQAVLDGYHVVYILQIVTVTMCALAAVVAGVSLFYSCRGLCGDSIGSPSGMYRAQAPAVSKTNTKSSNFDYDDYSAASNHGTSSRDYKDSRAPAHARSYEEWL